MRILFVEDDLRDADVAVRMLRKAARPFDVELASTIENSIHVAAQIRAFTHQGAIVSFRTATSSRVG